MKLNYKIFGEGEPLIIMHGLYGSLDNWVGIARTLQAYFKVILLDLRNHGKSPHDKEHNYEVMAEDILELYQDLQIYKATVIGHSMGGKVALSFALINPERIKRLVIVDISFRTYKPDLGDQQFNEHVNIMQALLSVNLCAMQTREEVDEYLSSKIPQDRIRLFLLKNLYRTRDKQFKWKMNLSVLYDQIPNVLKGFEYNIDEIELLVAPILFIKGGNSDYINEKDEMAIPEIFPNAKVIVIKDASHWVHAEKTDEFLSCVKEFCI